MRFDRFITLNLVQPWHRSLLRIGWGEGGRSPDEVHFTRHPSLVTSLPILMYHSISDDPESGVRPYYRVCTSPQRFREQMQWLKTNGYRGVTLSEGLKSKSEIRKQKAEMSPSEVTGGPLEYQVDSTGQANFTGHGNQKTEILNSKPESGDPKSEIKTKASSEISAFSFQRSALEQRTPHSALRNVVLTFDDGFSDFYTDAWPVLQEFGFTATMYLPTAFIASKSEIGNRKSEMPTSTPECHPSQHLCFHGKECLSWEEIQELHRAGIEFGSHTATHPKLTELSWPEIESEIRNSKSEIENRLGVPCPAFAYPYAFPQTDRDFVGRLKDLLTASGYASNVTTQLGRHRPGDDALQIKRLPVNQDDDPPLFAAKLAGAYDWLGRFQTVSKNLRRNRNTLACYADHKDQLESLVAAPIAHPDE